MRLAIIAMACALLSCAPNPLCVPHTTVWIGQTPTPAPLEAACSDYARYTARRPWEMLEGVNLLVWVREDVRAACEGVSDVACTIPHRDMRGYTIVVRRGFTSGTYLHHEGLHVLLYEQGVPGHEHHAIMRRWMRR